MMACIVHHRSKMDILLARIRLFGIRRLGGHAWVFFLFASFIYRADAFIPHHYVILIHHNDHRSARFPCVEEKYRRCILKFAEDDSRNRRRNGVYVRPSAAIERGSGFFVPGLEGFKVRILVGCVVILFTIFNHWYDQQVIASESGSSPFRGGNTFSESLAIVYGVLVLFQGLIEARKEGLSMLTSKNDDTAQANANVKLLQQQWSIGNSNENTDWRCKVEWAASTFLSLTPATNMILIGPGKVVFSLGTQSRRTISDEKETLGCSAALVTLAQSPSGRVSLPINHLSVQNLATFYIESTATAPRCAVLQRVDDQLCWLMTSDQLLVAFTAYDLQWLGQLAKFVNPAN